MTLSVREIPLSPKNQSVSVVLLNVTYTFTVNWRSPLWYLDIADAAGNPILLGVPLVTGVDLLKQYRHLGLGWSLIVKTDGDFYADPTKNNLGTISHLYFVVNQ